MRSSIEAATTGTSHSQVQARSGLGHGAFSAVLAHALLDAAESMGARRQAVQAKAGVVLSDSAGLGDWIDPSRFGRLIEAAVELSGDPAFGLRWGERSPLTNFGLVASLAQWSPSPRTALSELMRFQGLLFQGRPPASFSVCGASAVLRCENTLPSQVARRAWSEFIVVGTALLLERLCGRSGRCLRVSFDHDAPAHLSEYWRRLGDSVSFGAEHCTLEFDAALLDVTQPHFNQRLSEAVSFEASCALARLGGNQRCSSRVRELLSEAWPEVPTMDDLAPKLGMSSRTLRRRLEQEGTAFPVLVAEAQRARALRLLREPHASVKEVAYALGFATPSAFHRAFKRWTGSSPSEARASRASQDPAEEALSSP